MQFNPFKKLFETKKNPLARIYRTPLKQKIRDTFDVFWGDPGTDSYSRLGLFDYFTLGIPHVTTAMFEFLLQSLFSKLPRVKKVVEILISAPFFIACVIYDLIPRALFSVVGTLIAFPIILVVHLCSSLIAMKIKEKTFQVKIEQHDNNASKSTKIISLVEKLQNDGLPNIESYCVDVSFSKNNVFKYSLALHKDKYIQSKAPFAIIHIRTPLYANYVRQLAKLNFAGIGSELENHTEFSNYVDTIHKGSIPWNHEAAINGYICLMLLKLETKASRKSLPLALLFQIAPFLIPENLDIANEMGLMKTKTKAPFFLMKRASGILKEIHSPIISKGI